jgi:hypothetical protein
MFCVYTLRQHPLYTLASLVQYTLLQPLRIPKGARPRTGTKLYHKNILNFLKKGLNKYEIHTYVLNFCTRTLDISKNGHCTLSLIIHR